MNENEPNSPKCPRCGTTLPPNAPEGLCPRCIVAMNLSPETDIHTGEAGPGGTVVTKPAPAPPPPVEVIAKLFPQLEILETLGRGGMGAVYKARQPRLDRIVALKIISSEKKNDPQFAERFEREARTLARLHHPNIVAIYDFGETQGNFYLLMEFVDGLTLRQLLQSRKISPEEALAIVPKICEALQYAHQQGIIHRDIKPENILLDKKGQVKIADFGIAKIVGQQAQSAITQEQQIIGTPHYMAPEQVEHPQTVDHRADIYSLGVVLYEMLTNELPLGKFAPPSRKVQVDVRLDEVVLRALEKEPEHRYQHASQVKTDVETISSGSTKPLQMPAGVLPSAPVFAASTSSDKTILPAFLMAFFFGVFGAHRFYVGKIWTALLQLGGVFACILLIIACATTNGGGQPALGIFLGVMIVGCGIWATIDWILILCKAFTDGRGKRIAAWTNPNANETKPRGGNISGTGGNPLVFPSSSPNNPEQPANATFPSAGLTSRSSETKSPANTGKIIAPAVGLMIVGLLKLLSSFTGVIVLAGIQSLLPGFLMGNFGFDFPVQLGALAGVGLVIFKVIPSLLIGFGGWQMLRLRSYAWSIAAGILAVISCSLIGCPVGIWALIILSQSDVRDVFSKDSGSPSRPANAWPWIVGAMIAAVAMLALAVLVVGAAIHFSRRVAVANSSVNDSTMVEPATVELVDDAVAEEIPTAAVVGETNSIANENAITKRLVQSRASANFSKSFTVAPGGKLTMKVDRGNIRVVGSDENIVKIHVTREVTRADAATAAKLIEEHRIEVRQFGNEISVTAETPAMLNNRGWLGIFRQPNLNVDYEISVPRKGDAQLETSGGDVHVTELRGQLKVHTMGGNLDLKTIEGKVDGETMGGDIRATECKSEMTVHTYGGNISIGEFTGQSLQASTMGGNINADFAAAPTANCDLHTSGGNVTAKLPESAAITLAASTLGGEVNTQLSAQTQGKHGGNYLNGTINGGGPTLKLETMGGSINVLKR